MRDKAIKPPLSQARRLAMGGKVDRALRGITNVLQSKYSRVSHQKLPFLCTGYVSETYIGAQIVVVKLQNIISDYAPQFFYF